MKVLVVYYDGNENKAIFAETDFPDSSMPHMFGLGDECDIVAVVTGFKETEDFAVYIDEEEAEVASICVI